MAIQIQDFIAVLHADCKEKNSLGKLILDYGILNNKLNEAESQSWYFKKSIVSNRQKLLMLRNQFEEIRKEINRSSFDDLLNNMKLANNEKEKMLSKGQLNMIDRMIYPGILSEIDYYRELTGVKSRVSKMEEVDYYLGNGDELLKLLGWNR